MRRRCAPGGHRRRNGHARARNARANITTHCPARSHNPANGRNNSANTHAATTADHSANTYAHPHANAYPGANGNARAYLNPHANGNASPVAHSHTHGYANAFPYPSADGNTRSNAHTGPDSNANAHTPDADAHLAAVAGHSGHPMAEEQQPGSVPPA